MAPVSYPRAVANAALHAVLTSAWIAARELSPARRRLTRLGTVAIGAAITYATSPPSAQQTSDLLVPKKPELNADGDLPADTGPEFTIDKRNAAITAAVLGLSAAALIGRRRLEKRWLASLTDKGHPHPTRALALRMAPIEFTGQLLLQLADRRKPAEPGQPGGQAW